MKKTYKPDSSPRVVQREKLQFDLKIREFPWSEKQQELIELINDKHTKYVFVHGPAGTSKTLCAALCAIQALQAKQVGEIFYLRVTVESAKHTLGYLKGDLAEKFSPYLAPLEDKLAELLSPSEVKRLKDAERIKSVPLGHLRGRTFHNSFLIFDEAQNATKEDLLLAMTRMGKFSKMIICGDSMQPDVSRSGFMKVSTAFDEEEAKGRGIHTFRFGKEDVFRNEVLSFVLDRFEKMV